jgi:S-formylglutathione hydrolase
MTDLREAAPAAAGAQASAEAAALKGSLSETTIATPHAPAPVPAMVYTPPGYDPHRAEPYPLLIQLHGGGGNEQKLRQMAPLLERAIDRGLVPPMVSAMPAVGRSFYMDYRDGSQRWEQFVITDLLAHVRSHANVVQGRKGAFITGVSMGGMGSLRIAFKHRELFQAVASQEPGIEPAIAFDQISLRDRFWRSDALFEVIYGSPVDRSYWAANNPANIAAGDPSRLLGLEIYLEVGDQDMYYLNHGTEYLHRVLYDAGISHEYRLVKGAEHIGPSLAPRFLDAMAFIGRMIDPPHWVDEPTLANRKRLDGLKREIGYPVTGWDPNRIHTH